MNLLLCFSMQELSFIIPVIVIYSVILHLLLHCTWTEVRASNKQMRSELK